MLTEHIIDGADLLIDAANQLGECVIWCERTQRILWTDIAASTLWSHHPASGVTRRWVMPERLGSFALTQDDDRLLLGLASRLAYFDFSSGAVSTICTVEAELPSTRINDGRCDRQGRFVFGTCNEDPGHSAIGSFYRLNADLGLQRLPLARVAIPNSICFSPAGDRMYYCDSLAKTIRRCEYDPASGDVGSDTLFADLRCEPGVPDGSSVDAEGYLWNAQWGGNRVVRYAPDGSVDCMLSAPASQLSCIAFGGPELSELYVSSARIGLSGPALQCEPHAGGIFHCSLNGMRGLIESRFAGRR
jgi:L-arabinonolactonase